MSRKLISRLTSTSTKSTLKLLSRDSAWMPPSRRLTLKNALISFVPTHVLIWQAKTSPKPQLPFPSQEPQSTPKPNLLPMSKLKSKAPKRISSKEQDKWSNRVKENGKNVSKPSAKNPEYLKTFQPPFPKAGKRSRRSVRIFMKPPLKKYMKWLLLKPSRKPGRQRKILRKEPEILRRVQRMSKEMLNEKLKKKLMRPKRSLECNLKNLSFRTLRKELRRLGKMWRKVRLMSITKPHKNLANL